MTTNAPPLSTYANLGWKVFSLDLSFNPDTQKKQLAWHSASWKDADAPCRANASGYGLKTGKESGITAIDIDDPTKEHNKELMRMCEEAGGIRQNTKNGIHYLFAYTEDLKQTTNKKLALDIRNDGGFLLIEPSSYKVRNILCKYSIINLPDSKEDIPACPPAIVEYITKLYHPNLDERDQRANRKMMKDKAKTMNNEMMKTKADFSRREEDVRKLLLSIDKKHAEDYHDWICVGIALAAANAPWTLYDEFSRRSDKYKEGEPFYVYQSLRAKTYADIPFTISTLYWWLKQEQKDIFLELITEEANHEYEDMKREFEKHTFIVGAKLLHLHTNGTHSFLSDTDAKLMFANKNIRVYDQEKQKFAMMPFYNWWKYDENRLQYDRMDFIPNPEECPSDVYNSYKGLKGATYQYTFTEAELEELVEPILYHINMLTSEEPDYFIKWLANMVQAPWRKAETTILFRDMTRFLKSGGGTGKNLFIEWFGNTILGEAYFVVFGVNALLFDPFNELLENKLLVLIEEASGRDNGKEDNTLKSSITGKTKQINRKFCPKYTQKDYTNYIFFSNEANPIPMAGHLGQRRIAAYDVDVRHKDDDTYFKALADHLFNPRVSAAFYKWLMNQQTYTSPVLFQIKRPTTSCICDLRKMNASLLLRWVINRVESNRPIHGEVSRLFQDFQDWCSKRNERKTEDNKWSESKFIRELTSNPDVVRVAPGELYNQSTTYMKLSMTRLKDNLIKTHYIFDDRQRYDFLDESEAEE